MSQPTSSYALTLKEEGFTTTTPSGPYVASLEPYLEAKEVEVPAPGEGQVLIRLIMSPVNPSDVHFIKGEYGLPRVRGDVAGFEGCGEVIAAGAGGEELVGQRVAFTRAQTGTGAWSTFLLGEARSCIALPDAIKDEDAAAFFVNPLTAVGMINEVINAKSSAVIITAGASQLSKLMVGLARDRQLTSIVLVRRASQVQSLKDLGATHVLDQTSDSFAADLKALISETKPRVLLDAVADAVSSQVFFAMPSRARWLIYGLLDTKPTVLDQLGQLIFMGKSIEGFWLSSWLPALEDNARRQVFGEVVDRFVRGVWRTEVRERIPLREAHARLPKAMEGANVGKVMLVP
ncbi:MAG: zinc-binding dehydrogenase [Pseudomonadota bacterium]